MKPRDAIKLNFVELDKSKTYLEEEALPEDGLNRYLYQPGEQHRDKKQEPGNHVLNYMQDVPDGAFVHEEFIYVQEPPEWVSKWK